MNFSHLRDKENTGSGCGCYTEMSTSINSSEPVMKIIRCKKHEVQ